MFSARALTLGFVAGACCLLAGVETAWAAQPGATLDPRLLYECEAKAADYTKNLGKAGDKKIYEEHLKLCLEVGQPREQPRPGLLVAKPLPQTEDCHPITFVNNSAEAIWVGAWDGTKGRGVEPPAGWPNWELLPKATKTWCAPQGFNGRFAARARCDATGYCQEGDCGSGPDMTCRVTSQPASLAEFTFDSSTGTWYNVSYVDGYNFSVKVAPTQTGCSTLGVGNLPDCPWPTVNGICLAPYKQYEVDRPWYRYEQDYYVLAAKCAQDDVCGCGDQCTERQHAKPTLPLCPNEYARTHPVTKATVNLKSSGCSPFATYTTSGDKPDQLAKAQVICDPLSSKDPSSSCHQWPERYKIYTSKIHEAVGKAYTWQYHDDTSLSSCPNSPTLGFTITYGQRPANAKGNVNVVNFAPSDGLTGTIKVDSGEGTAFVGPTAMRLPIKEGSSVVIDRDCGQDKHLSCTATYTANNGFTASGSVCADPYQSGINWSASKTTLGLGAPSQAVCVPKDSSKSIFTIYAAGDLTATLRLNSGATTSFAGPNPYHFELKDKDAVLLKLNCDEGKSLTCTAKFSLATQLLNLDPGQPDCESAPADWGKTPLALHPGKPAKNLCK